jgi:hypothetical protein
MVPATNAPPGDVFPPLQFFFFAMTYDPFLTLLKSLLEEVIW